MGIIFTIVSLCLSFTIYGQFISFLSGFVIEFRVQALVKKGLYDHAGNLTAIILAAILVFIVIFSLIMIKKVVIKTGEFSRMKIAGLFTIVYLIIHPLNYYIHWWGYNISEYEPLGFYRDDIIHLDYTSLLFIPLGILFDTVINKTLSKRPIPL